MTKIDNIVELALFEYLGDNPTREDYVQCEIIKELNKPRISIFYQGNLIKVIKIK